VTISVFNTIGWHLSRKGYNWEALVSCTVVFCLFVCRCMSVLQSGWHISVCLVSVLPLLVFMQYMAYGCYFIFTTTCYCSFFVILFWNWSVLCCFQNLLPIASDIRCADSCWPVKFEGLTKVTVHSRRMKICFLWMRITMCHVFGCLSCSLCMFGVTSTEGFLVKHVLHDVITTDRIMLRELSANLRSPENCC